MVPVATVPLVELTHVDCKTSELTLAAQRTVEQLAEALDGFVKLTPAWQEGMARLEAGSRVGTLRVGRLRVDVAPRWGARELIALIRYALGGSAEPLGRSAIETGPGGLDELLCRVLADELSVIRQAGLSRNYVGRQDRLRVLRGRPDFVRSFPWDPNGKTEITCRYHELTCDNLDNQLIRAALERSALLPLSAGTRQRLAEHRCVWSELASSRVVTPTEFQTVRNRYTRLSEHYRLAHNLAEIVLSGGSPVDAFRTGTVPTAGLVLDMAALFERFVERLLEDELKRHGYGIRVQAHDRGALLDASGKKYREVRPDILVELDGLPVAVVDAKYKPYWEAGADGRPVRRIGNGDLYQLFFYAQRLRMRHGLPTTPLAVIVCPLPAADERGEARPIGPRYRTVRWQAGPESCNLSLMVLPMTEILRTLRDGRRPREVREAIDGALSGLLTAVRTDPAKPRVTSARKQVANLP